MAQEYRYVRREEYMPQDLVETHVDEWTTTGFPDGHEDHVVKRSVVVRDPNDGHVMQTQTTVEKVSKPLMNMYGTSPPALGVPVQVYKDHKYGGSYPASGEHMMVHRDHDYGGSYPANDQMKVHRDHNWEGHSPVSPLHQRHPRSDGLVSDIWSQRPHSNGHGGNTDNWKHGSDTNTYSGHGSHQNFEGYHGRNEMERHPVRYVTESTQSRHVVQPSVIQHETVPSSINSQEAAKRYGGISVPLQAIKEAKAYAPIINSNEAATRYHGQIF